MQNYTFYGIINITNKQGGKHMLVYLNNKFKWYKKYPKISKKAFLILTRPVLPEQKFINCIPSLQKKLQALYTIPVPVLKSKIGNIINKLTLQVSKVLNIGRNGYVRMYYAGSGLFNGQVYSNYYWYNISMQITANGWYILKFNVHINRINIQPLPLKNVLMPKINKTKIININGIKYHWQYICSKLNSYSGYSLPYYSVTILL